ncbi:DUF5694 domain-containing protein [Polaribacter porphyrae]|nr:DUF5694 domain-containing protein [Polaribacter porphyrae]
MKYLIVLSLTILFVFSARAQENKSIIKATQTEKSTVRSKQLGKSTIKATQSGESTIRANEKQRTKVKGHQSNKPIKTLLIGVSHWANYGQKGNDVVQTNEPDILSNQYQKELEEIASKIKKFNPDKIFVERVIDYQPKLDSLYQLYKTSNWGDNKRNEIYQLGFRIAKSLNHKRVYGVDFHGTQFPFDSIVKVIQQENQMGLMNEIQIKLQHFAKQYNKLVAEKKSLKEILIFLNTKENKKANLSLYLSSMSKVGKLDNNIGIFTASEWLRRNLNMYGFILKYIEPKDERIMVLLGAGHIAAIENMMDYNSGLEIIKLNELIDD